MHLSNDPKKLDPANFMKWGRQLMFAVQQELLDKLPESLDPRVTVGTDGGLAVDTFSFTVNTWVKIEHARTRSCVAYIYKDKLITDPKDYGIRWFSGLSFDDAKASIIDAISANLSLGSLELGESKLKHALAAGAVAAATLISGSADKAQDLHRASQAEHESDLKRLSFKAFMAKERIRGENLAAAIIDKYDVPLDFAVKVAKLAMRYEKDIFPKAEDILSVIGIESSFRPKATSNLKTDPAVGLMQVRPGVWGLDKDKLKTNIESQVKVGSEILHKMYVKVKSKEGALQAYNVGLTNYLKKKGLNPRYVPKFNNEREMYESAMPGIKAAILDLQQQFIDKGYGVKLIKGNDNVIMIVRKNDYSDSHHRRLIGAITALTIDLEKGTVVTKLDAGYAKPDFSDVEHHINHGFESEMRLNADFISFLDEESRRQDVIDNIVRDVFRHLG